jgi:hypothetical protein
MLAWAVGAGLRNVKGFGFRGRTSKRGMGWLNGGAPNNGLGGAPVGIESA